MSAHSLKYTTHEGLTRLVQLETTGGFAEEFALASAIMEARSRESLTQEELAAKMETSQSAIVRLENGRTIQSAQHSSDLPGQPEPDCESRLSLPNAQTRPREPLGY